MNAESKKLQMNTSRHVTDDFFADHGMSLEAQLHRPVSLTRNKRSQHAVQNGLLFSAFKRTFYQTVIAKCLMQAKLLPLGSTVVCWMRVILDCPYFACISSTMKTMIR
jgi:hypothetical protein